ncbi:MAG TPA: dihydroorotate dehydrogenase-like protein [Pyrinomonadaceae bacterium]|jgi:dihydroorotate dehydrogenase (fumarate)|nr:dihydroorotate dehydrogenase-like protein [Pyrinomonadaceae bacterium]
MNLTTSYLGITLPHPLIVGAAGALTDDLNSVKQLEDAGAAALVLRSLYEEEITSEQMSSYFHSDGHSGSSAEAETYFPDPLLALGPDEYLEHLQRVKAAVSIPVIASLNGVTTGGWTSYAQMLEQAGANAIELNLYHSASDASQGAAEVEAQMIETVRDVKSKVAIPVAAKLSTRFTAFANFAIQLDQAGVDGFVLFHRLHDVDIDVLEYDILRSLSLSDSSDLQVGLRGVAVLSGRVNASLAITGGVHTALDVVKATMTGAHVCQLVSALIANGPGHLGNLLNGVKEWMTENDWASLEEMRGNMSFHRVPDPGAYERDAFRRMFH